MQFFRKFTHLNDINSIFCHIYADFQIIEKEFLHIIPTQYRGKHDKEPSPKKQFNEQRKKK